MKHRLKYHDTSWLFFTPFAFLNMGGTDLWTLERKKYWWNKWEVIERYNEPEPAYIRYFKLHYDIDIKESMVFPHNQKKGEYVTCHLEFKFNNYSKDYRYTVGYKPRNYVNYYHACYSGESYEAALWKLYSDMELKKILDRNESYMKVERQRHELEKIELEPKIY